MVRIKGVAQEIALLRIRIQDLLRFNAPNSEFFEALDLLNRLVATQDRVTGLHF